MATSGTAEYFLHASSVTNTRKAHQITACTLNKLLKTAFKIDRELSDKNDIEQWCQA